MTSAKPPYLLFPMLSSPKYLVLAVYLCFFVCPAAIKAQVDTISQKDYTWMPEYMGGPIGSPGQDYELIVTRSARNFAKHAALQPNKYRKVLFHGVDSIPDEIGLQRNLEEIYIHLPIEFFTREFTNPKLRYISKAVLELPHLKRVQIYPAIPIELCQNLLNPQLESLILTVYSQKDSKFDPASLIFPIGLKSLRTNMVDGLESPLLQCKTLQSFEYYQLDSIFSPVITQLKTLKSLGISMGAHEGIDTIPDLTPLTNLEDLRLRISTFTKAIDLTPIYGIKIKHLTIVGPIPNMIKEICQLPELESLYLSSYEDGQWDTVAAPCQLSLRKLRYEGHLIDPWAWLDINWKQLRYLLIANSGWKNYHLDDYVTELQNVGEYITLPSDFTLAPDADTLVLIHVKLPHTRLLPASPGLRHILLANNNLQSLPPACSVWVHLRYLNLSHNQLHDLPDGLQALQSLDTLNLNANRFTRFPRVLLRGLSPRFVSLTNNELRSIPKDIDLLAHTEVLDLRGNQIARIPTATLRAIQHMPRLKELRLADNPVRPEDIPVELRGKLVF